MNVHGTESAYPSVADDSSKCTQANQKTLGSPPELKAKGDTLAIGRRGSRSLPSTEYSYNLASTKWLSQSVNTSGARGVRLRKRPVKIAFIISAVRRRAKARAAAASSHPLLENGSYKRKREATTLKPKKRQNSPLLCVSDTRTANAQADDRTILHIKNTNDSFTGGVNSSSPKHDFMPDRSIELSKPRVQSRRFVDRTACVAMGTALLAIIFVSGFIAHEISIDKRQGDLQVQKLASHHLEEKRLRKINPGGLFTGLDNGGYLMAESPE